MKILIFGIFATFLVPVNAATIGGDIAAWFSFPDSGFSATFFGNGITFDIANVTNPGGGSQQALCTANCEFSAWEHGNEGNSATIGASTSASFAFDLKEIGGSGEFIGSLTLYVPFTTVVTASADLDTFLLGAAVSNGLPEHVETDFQFSPSPGPTPPGGGTTGGGPTPEPSSWLLLAGGLTGLALSRRKRNR